MILENSKKNEIRKHKYDDMKHFEFDKKVEPFGAAGISLLYTTLKGKNGTFKTPWFFKRDGKLKTSFDNTEYMSLYSDFFLEERKTVRRSDGRTVEKKTENKEIKDLTYKFNYRLFLEATCQERNHAFWVIGCITAKAFQIPLEEFTKLHEEFFPNDKLSEAIEKYEGGSMTPHLKSTLTIVQKTKSIET